MPWWYDIWPSPPGAHGSNGRGAPNATQDCRLLCQCRGRDRETDLPAEVAGSCCDTPKPNTDWYFYTLNTHMLTQKYGKRQAAPGDTGVYTQSEACTPIC